MLLYSRVPALILCTAAATLTGSAAVLANPLGAQVVGGSATVSGQGSATVTVTQGSERAILNWRSFDIGRGETTRFVQPNSGSIALNRVTGGEGPSQIFGTLTANGRVLLVNPDGVLFGRNAVVDTAGFLATTNDIRNDDFMAGRYAFTKPGRSDASIVNLGSITARDEGFAALVAPGVRNAGTITAKLGKVALASGNRFTLDFYGDKLISLAVDDQVAGAVKDIATGKTLRSLVKNEGTIRADGGRVELSAVAARKVVDSVINNTGVVEANSISRHNGMIVLGAATRARKPAKAPVQTVKVSGTLSAAGNKAGETGGKVEISGEEVTLAGATIDVSGADGGGTLLIGGDWSGGHPAPGLVSNPSAVLELNAVPTATMTTVDAASTLDASATMAGNGGKVIVWADQTTSFAGTITARGGASSGDGGFVETSGHQTLAFTGTVDTLAPNGAAGTLLLDPADYYINPVAGGPKPPAGASTMDNVTLQNQLAKNDVVIQTDNASNPAGQNGDIFVNADITWSSNNSLTLNAYRNIVFNADVAATGANAGLVLNTNLGGGGGNYSFNTGMSATLSGANASLTINGTHYTLLHSMADVQNINNNLSGSYALASPLDATGVSWIPLGTDGAGNISGSGFTGTFAGLGHTISNLTVTIGSSNHAGLFGYVGNKGMIRDLLLANINVTATADYQNLGTLVGENNGTIDNVSVDGGTVSAGSFSGANAGGLVGNNVNGTIENSSANVAVDGNAIVGGLVGTNFGAISQSHATGDVTGMGDVGGLIGDNFGSVAQSYASGNVSSDSVNLEMGGLVGYNAHGATITSSYATGDVTASAPIASNNGIDCSVAGNCQWADVGGLVGYNSGAIQGGSVPAPGQPCVAGQTCASGAVSIGSNATGGGLVGSNDGIIADAFATGDVTGAAGSFAVNANGNSTELGGLAGDNQGLVGDSYASGNVGTANIAALNVGGLVAENGGTIQNSRATGNVSAGDNSNAGGLTADNGPWNAIYCYGCYGDGSAYYDTATIRNSHASGNVTVGATSLAGGLSGSSDIVSTIADSDASGAVTSGSDSVIGGLVGATNLFATITNATASGPVSSIGPNSWVGGFIGGNGGAIASSSASGPVSGTSESLLGGFVGLNIGSITDSTTSATATVTGTGANNFVGGFAAVNLGSIDPSTAAGAVSGGPNNVVGGFVAANARLAGFPDNFIPGSSFPAGTISAGSLGTGSATGGAGSTVGNQVGTSYPSALPAAPAVVATCENGKLCTILQTGLLLTQPSTTSPNTAIAPPQSQFVVQTQPVQLVSQTQSVLPNTSSSNSQQGNGQNQGQHGGNSSTTGGIGGVPHVSGLPPPGETRFLPNQLVVQIGPSISPQRLAAVARRLGLRIVGSQSLGLTGTTIVRFAVTGHHSIVSLIQALAHQGIYSQPNYVFSLAKSGPPAAAHQAGGPEQYAVQKLKLDAAHRLANGNHVLVAVIDSEIDASHPDIAGAIAARFDAVGKPGKPNFHGTGIAGAIVAHHTLVGVAPDVKILAIRAFSANGKTAQGTTFQIVKALNWAVRKGAHIVNMSFAGPRDPSLEKAFQVAHAKGVVLVAAAGNAGPKAAPLYPGADADVIAVTATDAQDKVFSGANRGKYILAAAPGVDVIAPAPADSYQLMTGTSVAAAEVTGVVALLLQHHPHLTPDWIRKALTESAKHLGPTGANPVYGAGLVDPVAALKWVDAHPQPARPARTSLRETRSSRRRAQM